MGSVNANRTRFVAVFLIVLCSGDDSIRSIISSSTLSVELVSSFTLTLTLDFNVDFDLLFTLCFVGDRDPDPMALWVISVFLICDILDRLDRRVGRNVNGIRFDDFFDVFLALNS